MVSLRRDNWVDLGECRWGAVRSTPALLGELWQKLTLYPSPRGATLGRLLFVRQKPKAMPELPGGTRCYDLADLYA